MHISADLRTGSAPFLHLAGDNTDKVIEQAVTVRTDNTGQACNTAKRFIVISDLHEEFFGPVAVLYRVADEEETVALANDTPFGLGSYVFTTDQEQALRVADQLEAGMVFVNYPWLIATGLRVGAHLAGGSLLPRPAPSSSGGCGGG